MDFQQTLNETIAAVAPPDEGARRAVKRRWDEIAKPLSALGLFETAIADIAALQGTARVSLTPRTLLILCSDNGVTAQGVSQCESAVTAAAAVKIAAGQSAAGRMATCAHLSVRTVDLGIRDFPGAPGVEDRRVGNGTADFTRAPAMTRLEALRAILTGVELVREEAARGTRLIAAGEMGIGNSTTAAAVTAALLKLPPAQTAGRGAGLSDQGLARKIAAIRKGLYVNQPDPDDPVDVLAKVGGFDLAGLSGVFLGGALFRIPVVLDGFMSAAAALCAVRLCPACRGALIASHVSSEPGSERLLAALALRAPIRAGMHLGEGTGAVALIPLLDMTLAVYEGAYTFSEGGITPYTPQC